MLPEIDYSQLNPGIRKLVKLLRDYEFDTRDSGDGKTHEFECDSDFPYVHIIVEPADSLIGESDRIYRVLRTELTELALERLDIQSNYLPVERMAFISVMNVSDGDLRPDLSHPYEE